MRRIVLFASISALFLAVLPLGPVQAAGGPDPDKIPGSYIVVLKDGEPGAVAGEHSRRHNASVTHVYRHALRGYAARMSERAAANVARDSRVAYVEQDGVVTSATTQGNATWGLDRIDQREGLNSTYNYANTGAGVTAYVIDTGIYKAHADLAGRAFDGYDAVDGDSTADDCNGHGTHVAGTVGGAQWGVAKGVKLVAVRVLNCSGSGTWSGVIAGIDWVTADHAAGTPAVANMSLGGGANSSVDTAVRNSISDGVTYAVAAGNGNQGGKEQDACGYSPARVTEALTIGATTREDSKTSWSNYGDCVDFFAPGHQITSAWINDDYSGDGSETRTISGTSMATPHVAGAAALYLETHKTAAPTVVMTALHDNTTKNIVTSSRTANNDLLYTGWMVPLTVPDAPSDLTANATSSSSIELRWTDNSNNEDHFEIHRSTDGGTSWTMHDTATTNAFTDTGLTAGETYHYKVRAYNTAGASLFSNVASATPAATVPDAPSDLIADATSSSSIELRWTDNSNNEDHFEIHRSTDGGTSWTMHDTATTNAFTDTGLTAGQTYHYKVRAYNSDGASAFSNVASASTPAESGDPITAAFTYSCSKSVCKFDASSSTGTDSQTLYSWDFGDGGSDVGITSAHAYSTTATADYMVVLDLNGGGGAATATTTISCGFRGPNIHCK